MLCWRRARLPSRRFLCKRFRSSSRSLRCRSRSLAAVRRRQSSAKLAAGDVAVVGNDAHHDDAVQRDDGAGEGELQAAGPDVPEAGDDRTTRRSRARRHAARPAGRARGCRPRRWASRSPTRTSTKRLAQIKKQYFKGSETKYQAQLKKAKLTDAQFREDIKQQLDRGEAVREVTKNVKVSDAAVEAYYKSHISLYTQAASRDVQYMLVKTKAIAESLYTAAEGERRERGARSRRSTRGTRAGENCGKATFTKGADGAAFDTVLFSAEDERDPPPVYDASQYKAYFLIEPALGGEAGAHVHAAAGGGVDQADQLLQQAARALRSRRGRRRSQKELLQRLEGQVPGRLHAEPGSVRRRDDVVEHHDDLADGVARRSARRAPGADRAAASRVPVGPRADGDGRSCRTRSRRRTRSRTRRSPTTTRSCSTSSATCSSSRTSSRCSCRSAARATSRRSRASSTRSSCARHPHVFGEVEAGTAERVRANWEQIKRDHEGREGIFHDVARDPSGAALRAQGAAAREARRLRVPGPRRRGRRPRRRAARAEGGLVGARARRRALRVRERRAQAGRRSGARAAGRGEALPLARGDCGGARARRRQGLDGAPARRAGRVLRQGKGEANEPIADVRGRQVLDSPRQPDRRGRGDARVRRARDGDRPVGRVDRRARGGRAARRRRAPGAARAWRTRSPT